MRYGLISAIACVALLGIGFSVAGSGNALGSDVLPAANDLPRNTFVVVSHVPVGLGRITKHEFQRALSQAAAQNFRKHPPQPGDNGYRQLQNFAVGTLLDSVWLQGQAAEMGITVTPQQVSREVEKLRRENFKDIADYRRFLKHARFSPRDVNEKVKLQLLSNQIQRRVPSSALKQFVNDYEMRWRARTICAPGYAIPRCSNGNPDAKTTH